MVNRQLFKTNRGRLLPSTNTKNQAGGAAYYLTADQALAQLAATGCLNGTFYAGAESQLDALLALANHCEPEFVAQVAVYSHRVARMKDTPTLLLASLAERDGELFERIFDSVVTNGRQLRGFVQMIRSGVVGRKSLGTRPRRLVRRWLERQDTMGLLHASIGQSPSLADVIKMVHPKPTDTTRAAFYGWIIGREVDVEQLPVEVREYERFKASGGDTPKVPFALLTSRAHGVSQWTDIARNASWQQTRMNLNTFARHGVLDDHDVTNQLAARIRNPELVEKAGAQPYQLLVALLATGTQRLPAVIRDALHDALEISTRNVPKIDGSLVVCPDVSGSMTWSALTGMRAGATSAVRCIDVAALIAAALLRKNPAARVLPFDTSVVDVRVESRDSILTNAERLASIGGGGTSVSAPLVKLEAENAKVDLVVIVSDNQSWVDSHPGRKPTRTMEVWERIRARNPKARLVLLDIQPYTTSQVVPREDILHVGGFSDAVFDVLAHFARGDLSGSAWVDRIRSTDLGPPLDAPR